MNPATITVDDDQMDDDIDVEMLESTQELWKFPKPTSNNSEITSQQPSTSSAAAAANANKAVPTAATKQQTLYDLMNQHETLKQKLQTPKRASKRLTKEKLVASQKKKTPNPEFGAAETPADNQARTPSNRFRSLAEELEMNISDIDDSEEDDSIGQLAPTSNAAKATTAAEAADVTTSNAAAAPNTATAPAPTGSRAAKFSRTAKPKPILIPEVNDIMPIIEGINNVIGDNYVTKPTAKQGLRIQCNDVDSYRKLVHHFQENQIQCHTYQLEHERGFRAVIRYLHKSTPMDWIRTRLADLGFKVRYLDVIKKRYTREPLDLFEVEFEQAENILDVLKLNKLGNQQIVVERPLRSAEVAQCHRCQQFGHTKNYCRRPFVCVKCAGAHQSTACLKEAGEKPKCANCKGQHAASYRGCQIYKNACKTKEPQSIARANHILNELGIPQIHSSRQQQRLPQAQQQIHQQHQTAQNTPAPIQKLLAAPRITPSQQPQQTEHHINSAAFSSYAAAAKNTLQQRDPRQRLARREQALPEPLSADQNNPTPLKRPALRSRSRSVQRSTQSLIQNHVNDNLIQKLDTLTAIIIEDREQRMTANAPSGFAKLERKIDQLMDVLITVVSSLQPRQQANGAHNA